MGKIADVINKRKEDAEQHPLYDRLHSYVAQRDAINDEEDRRKREEEERKKKERERAAQQAAERAAEKRHVDLESTLPTDRLRSSAKYLYSDAALKKNEKTIDELGGAGSTAAMRAALAAEQIAKTTPKKTTSGLDRYTPAKDTLGNLKDAIASEYKADRFSSGYDALYGAGAGKAAKAGAWGTAISENTRYHNEKEKEKILKQFGSMEAYEDAVRAYRLGWNKGEVDPERAAARTERRAEINGELSKINSDIERLKAGHTPMVNDKQYQRQLAILEGKKKRLEDEAASYDSFQSKIDAGDQFAIMESRLYGGDSESRELTYAELSEEVKRLEGVIESGKVRQKYITHDDGTVEYLTANPARYEEYVTADGVKTGKTNEEALEWLRMKLKTYERQYRPEDRYYELIKDYDKIVSSPSFDKSENNRFETYKKLRDEGWYAVSVSSGEGNTNTHYEYYNKNGEGRELNTAEKGALVAGKLNYWDQFNEDDLKIIRALYGTGRADEADQFAEDMAPNLGKRELSEYEKRIAEASALEKILLGISGTFKRTVGGVPAFMEDVGETLAGREINPYSYLHSWQNQGQAIMEQTAADVDKMFPDVEIFGQSAGKIYQGLQSGIDSGASRALFGRASSFIMGMGAAASTAKDLWEKGASDEQIAVGAGLAGIAETVFEYISLEMALKNFLELPPTTRAEWIAKGATQMLVEGSEEYVTDGVNLVTDFINMHTQSEFAEMMRKYTDQGYSDAEAFGKAIWWDALNGKLRDSFIGGALGTVFSTGGALVGSYGEVQGTGRDVQNMGAADRLIKAARDISEKIPDSAKRSAIERAADRAARTQNAADVGFLANAVENAVNNNIEDAGEQSKAAERVVRALYGGNDYMKASDPVSGDAVTVDRAAPIARTEDGNVYMNTDRGEVALEDLAFEDDEVRDMIYRVAEYGAEHANNILSNYGGEDVEAYVSGMKEGIIKGQYGDLGEELSDFNALSAADQKVALNIGRTIRADRVAAERRAAKAARLSELNVRGRDLTKQDMKIEGVKAGRGASGRVGQLYFDQGVKVESDLDRANADFAKLVSLVYGNDIVVFDSEQNPELKNKNGMHVGSDGSIWVDIKAGEARQGLVAYALSHEMTHEAAQWAPEAYRAFTDFLVKNYAEQGVSVRQLVSKKMADMGTDSFDAAFDEVIADACERFLLDSNAITKLNEMRKTDRKTFEKIRDFIKSAIAKLKAALQSLKTAGRLEGTEASEAFRNSATGEQIEELEKKIKQLEDAWSMVLVEAAANRAKASGNSEFGIRNAESKTDVKYSERLTKDDYARYMELAKDPEKNKAELSRMVEEAAKAAGYDIKAYHATDASFTVFDKSKSGANTDYNASDVGLAATAHLGYWFNTNDLSKNLGGNKAIRSFLKINRPYMAGTVQGLANDILVNAEAWAGDFNQLDDQFYEDKKIAAEIGEAFQDKLVWDKYDGIELSDEEFGGTSYVIFESNQAKSADPVTYDDKGNVIPLSERFNEERDDIRYSTRTGAAKETQSENFKRWFGDSKVVNEDGSPKVMYHGTNASFSTFDKAKAKPGAYGRGFYFTSEQSQANVYGKTIDAYLKIENPLSPGETKITEKQIRAFLKAVAENEDYSIENYGTYDVDEIAQKITSRDAFSVIQDVSATAIGDVGEAIDLFNSVNGTRFDGVITPTESVVYQPTQIKSATGNVGTYDKQTGDIYHSTRTGTSTSTRAVVERALETAKEGSPEKTALTAYKRVLDQIDETIAEYSEARKNRDASAAAEAKKQLNTLQAKARKMETAPAMQNVAAMQDVAALNEDVRNLSRLLKLQSTETGGAIAMKSSLERAASDLMKGHGVKRGKAELVELLNNFYTDMTREVRAETLNREYMVAAAQPIAEWLVENAPNQTEIDTEINDVLKYIKGSKIRVNDQQRGDIENKYESFEKWRKSLFPYVTVTTDPSATTLDSFWADLAAQYPDYFDADLSWADQGVELSGVLSNLKSGRVTEYYLSPEARSWLVEAAANDVAEAFWRIKPYETVADKYAKEIRRLKEDHKAYRNIDEYIQDQKQAAYDLGFTRAKMQEARRELRRKLRNLTENMSTRLIKPQQNKYIPESLKAATAEVLKAIDLDSGRSESLSERFAQLRAQYDKIIQKQKEGARENSKYPITEADQVVEDTLKLVEERVRGVPVKDMTLSQLDAVYTALKVFDHVVRDAVNAESMNTLLDERKSVQEIGEEMIGEIEEEHKKRDRKGEVKTNKQGEEITKDRKGKIARYFDWQLRPEEFFNNLAGYKKNSMWHRVYQMLNNAQRQQIMYEMQGNDIFRDVLADEKYVRSLSARKDADRIDIGLRDEHEDPYKVTRGMMLAIYKHLQNEDNMRHIMVGGLVTPDLDAYYSGKTKDVYSAKKNRIFGVIGKELASAYKNIETKIDSLDDRWEAAMIRGDAESMDAIAAERDAAWKERDDILAKGREIMDQIRKNIESKLTDQDRALLAASDKFFNEFSPEILNAATKRMYGFDKARVENYFPIHVSRDFLGANFETIKHDFSVEGMGFMKDRIQSSKPIMLEDLAAVIDRQIRNVAKYAALAPALKDFSKIYSVSTGGTEFTGSVSSAIENAFGERGNEYIENLIADLNGARDREVSILDRLRSRGAGAVLMLNPRVSMVQAASYATAAAELGYGPLARALVNPEGKSVVVKKAPRDLIAKYTGMLWTRAQGNIDASVAAVKKIGNTRGLAEKKLRFLPGWIEAVDNATVGRLWYAAEYYVQKKNPELKGYKNSPDQAKVDEYYMKVAEVFSDVIERTQPNYTVMQRPAVLRSTNAMTKALTMFLTQRLQNASILYSASKRYAKYVSDYRMNGRNGVTKADVKETGADLARAVTSQIVSAATIAGMRLVADMLLRNMKGRRDEDKEVTGESIGWSLLNDFLSSAISNFLGGSELYEVIRAIVAGGNYYGLSVGGFDNINDFVSDSVDAVKKLAQGKFIKEDGTVDGNKLAAILTGVGTDAGTVFGLPVGNAYKIAKAIKGWGEALVNEEAYKRAWFEYGTGEIWESGPVERTNKQKASIMLKAYREGDAERFREIRDQFNATSDKTARENADENLVNAVYEEWAAGAIDDREALDILEDCLAKPPKTENDERIQIGNWTAKKESGSVNDYGIYDELNDSMIAYVYPENNESRVTAGRKAQKTIDQYRAWGYSDSAIQEKITNAFKPEYDFMTDAEKSQIKPYIVKLYEFAGQDAEAAKKRVDQWKPTEDQIAKHEAEKNGEEEEKDERPFG